MAFPLEWWAADGNGERGREWRGSSPDAFGKLPEADEAGRDHVERSESAIENELVAAHRP
ncbi:hypothetical protein GCM10010441_71310 [Kitasatospora paracochleata]